MTDTVNRFCFYKSPQKLYVYSCVQLYVSMPFLGGISFGNRTAKYCFGCSDVYRSIRRGSIRPTSASFWDVPPLVLCRSAPTPIGLSISYFATNSSSDPIAVDGVTNYRNGPQRTATEADCSARNRNGPVTHLWAISRCN